MNRRFLFAGAASLLTIPRTVLSAGSSGSPGLPTTWYVSTSGSDSNPGTISSPFLTATKADSVVQPGQTVYFRAGTYAITGTGITLNTNGSAGLPITFAAYPNEIVIFDGTGMTAGNEIFSIFCNYRTFVGLVLQNSPHNAWFSYNSHHHTWVNCATRNNQRNGWLINSDTAGTSHDHLLQSCTSTADVQINAFGTHGSWSSSIQAFGQTGASPIINVNFIGCTCTGGWGEGINFVNVIGGSCTDSFVSDCWSVQAYTDGSQNISWLRNFVYSTGITSHQSGGKNPAGFAFAYDSGSQAMSGIVVASNIVVGNDTGLQYFTASLTGGTQGMIVANNTFANQVTAGIKITADAGNSANVASNNIFYLGSAGTNQAGSVAGWTGNHNCWFNGASAGNWTGTGDITSNPTLTSPTILAASSFRPIKSSPALAAGTTVSSAVLDYTQNTRIGTYSMGAYQVD